MDTYPDKLHWSVVESNDWIKNSSTEETNKQTNENGIIIFVDSCPLYT